MRCEQKELKFEQIPNLSVINLMKISKQEAIRWSIT